MPNAPTLDYIWSCKRPAVNGADLCPGALVIDAALLHAAAGSVLSTMQRQCVSLAGQAGHVAHTAAVHSRNPPRHARAHAGCVAS